jgi:integrase
MNLKMVLTIFGENAMPRLTKNKIPMLRTHASGQYVVRLSGFDHYLGHDLKAAKQKYGELIGQWEAKGRTTVYESSDTKSTIEWTVKQYLDYCSIYYVKRGKPTSQVKNIKAALEDLVELFGSLPMDQFQPKSLLMLIEKWINDGLVRRSVNDRHRITTVFLRWAGVRGYCQVDAWMKSKIVDTQRIGRSKAPDRPERKPPPSEDIQTVREYTCERVKDMIDLQIMTGMRSCEICAMRPQDIDRSNEIWVYVVPPEFNKTSHRNKIRKVALGEKAKAIISKYLPMRLDSQEIFQNQYRTKYTPENYRGVIRFACQKNKIPIWSPHALRHLAATEIRRKYGVDAARAVLGHSDVTTTLNYAKPEPDLDLACKVAIDRQS